MLQYCHARARTNREARGHAHLHAQPFRRHSRPARGWELQAPVGEHPAALAEVAERYAMELERVMHCLHRMSAVALGVDPGMYRMGSESWNAMRLVPSSESCKEGRPFGIGVVSWLEALRMRIAAFRLPFACLFASWKRAATCAGQGMARRSQQHQQHFRSRPHSSVPPFFFQVISTRQRARRPRLCW